MMTRSSRLSSILLLLAGCLCLTSLRAQEVDTVYLLNHWSKSRQAGSWRDFKAQGDKAVKDKDFHRSEAVGWDCLRPAWRGIQDSIDLALFRYHYVPYRYCTGVLRFFVKEEPIVLSRERMKSIRFTPTKHFIKAFEEYEYSIYERRFKGKPLFIVHVTDKGAWLYSVFHFTDKPEICEYRIGGYPYSYESLYRKTERELTPEELKALDASKKRLSRIGMDACE
jgi:lipoprotein